MSVDGEGDSDALLYCGDCDAWRAITGTAWMATDDTPGTGAFITVHMACGHTRNVR